MVVNMKAKLHYVYDPMCSWCWGYAPTWKKLKAELAEHIDIQYCLGGLAKDSDLEMPSDMQEFLQNTWKKISLQLGTEFNFNFWKHCKPRRSTYPACRAALVARQYEKESEMLTAIQHAYYLHAKNPSNIDTLLEIAEKIGLEQHEFTEHMQSKHIQHQLMAEINKARAMPIRGFPSLVLEYDSQFTAISIDYKNWQTTFNTIIKKFNTADNNTNC